jgi:hypothetical protein
LRGLNAGKATPASVDHSFVHEMKISTYHPEIWKLFEDLMRFSISAPAFAVIPASSNRYPRRKA